MAYHDMKAPAPKTFVGLGESAFSQMHLPDTERGLVLLGVNFPLLRELSGASIALNYIDPPFNSGSPRSIDAIETRESESGRRTRFKSRGMKARSSHRGPMTTPSTAIGAS